MNEKHVEGAWDQLMGKARKAYGGLTDDDFQRAKGSMQSLYGTIKEKFGDTEEMIRKKLSDLTG